MPFPVAAWNEKQFGSPRKAGYNFERRSAVLRSDPQYAPPVYTAVGRANSSLLQLSVPMTLTQWISFLDFFENTIDRGQAWFTMNVQVPGGKQSGVAHIEAFDVEVVGRGFTHALVTVSMEWVEDY